MTRLAARAALSVLEQRLGHHFDAPEIAGQALTHMSAAMGQTGRNPSYQRLEFLGDRVLGLVVSAMLYAEYPQAAEGELSRRLAALVRKETCAEIGAEWELDLHIALGSGEIAANARGRQAILADVCEALIGAVFLDGGFSAAEAVISRAWMPRLLSPRRALRDGKTALQEWAQALGRPPPAYLEVERSGPAHAPLFVISVSVAGFEPMRGNGTSKRTAEQAAADAFLAREGVADGSGETRT